jgi:phosphate-selective porin OprO/OprP
MCFNGLNSGSVIDPGKKNKTVFSHLGLSCLLLILSAMALPGFANAQEQMVSVAEDAPAETEPEEQNDRAADIRDAINENLVDPVGKQPEEAEGKAEEPVPPPDTEQVREQSEEPWYTQFQSVTESVQTLPDRIPGLQGRGWIHFGRVEAEYGHFSGGALDNESGFNFRSLRGGLLRQVNEKTTVKLELDVTDGDSNFVDLWARFRTRFGIITVGNQRVAQTLVNQTSRLSRTFQEVPLPADAFGLGRRLGVGWDVHREKLGGHLTAFGSDLNDNIGKFGYGARFYFNPTRRRLSMFHLGLSAVQEKIDRDARFRAYPETRVTDIRLVDTGRWNDVDDQSIVGVELAAAKDSYSLRSEYFKAEWHRSNGNSPKFDGFYIQANWAITGEPFKYTQGKFLRIRPERSIGAFEVALRYSTLDLNDREVQGGSQTNTSVALNWYGPGNQLRVQSTLIHYDTDEIAGNEDDYVAQVRVQVHW